jgi:hypothetical protein
MEYSPFASFALIAAATYTYLHARGSRPSYRGPSKAQILAHRASCIGPNCEVNYPKSPLLILRGFQQYLYDECGAEYLDCVNNVAHVGHSHPRVVAAVAAQMAALQTNSRYLHPHITEYARRLGALLPGELKVVYWVNSGSEANDLALRLARAFTGRRGVIAVDGAYHGHTTVAIDVSPYKYARELRRGERGYVRVVPQPDEHSGVARGEGAGARYAEFVDRALAAFREDEAAEAAWRASAGAGAASAETRLPTMSKAGAAAAAAPLLLLLLLLRRRRRRRRRPPTAPRGRRATRATTASPRAAAPSSWSPSCRAAGRCCRPRATCGACTRRCAPRAACASRTRCRWALGAWAHPTFGPFSWAART